MWPSPFLHITPPACAAAAGKNISSQANQQQFPPGCQQQIPQATPMQYPIPRPGGVASFQPLGSPLASHSPFNSMTVPQNPLRGPQVIPATTQVPNRSAMQRSCPQEIPSPVPQSLPFNSPLWQMRNLNPSTPSPGLTHQQPFMPSTVPSSGGVLLLPQRPFVPSTVPSSVGSLIPPQRPFAPSTVPTPVGSVTPPQRPFAPFTVPTPVGSVTPPQRPIAPSTVPTPVGSVTQPQRPFAFSHVPSPGGALSPPQRPSALSAVPTPVGSVTQSQRPFAPSPVPYPRGTTTPPQSPFASSTLPSPSVVTTPPQRQFAPSTLPSPGRVSTPPQRQFAPAHGGFPIPPQQQFLIPAVPSPKRVLSPPQQPFVPTTVPSPSGIRFPGQQSVPFNSLPNGTFRPPPQQSFLSSTAPSPRVLSPPRQPFVTSTATVPSPRGITYPGQQTSPFNSPSWQVPNSQPSSPNLNQGPAFVPSAVPSPRGMPSPVLQSLALGNSVWHQRSPQPSGFGINQGPSIAAALDRHIMEKQLRGVTNMGVAGQGTNVHPPPPPQQFSPIGQSTRWRTPSLPNPQKRAGFYKDGERGREHRNRRHFSPGSFGSGPRISRCFSPPPPDIVRVMKSVSSEEYYTKKENDQAESCHIEGTEKLTELQDRFEKEILNMKSLEQDDEDDKSISSDKSHHTDQDKSSAESLAESDVNGSPVKSRLRLFPSDDEENSDEDSSEDESHALSDSSSESDNDEGVELSEDDNDDDEDSDEGSKGPSVVEIRKRKIEDPRRLHPELWFNESGETNDGPVCRCSSSDKRQGIRHGIYPGETVITPCDPLTNNADKLHHYWVTVTPHTNFMTSNPSIIHVEGKDYTFEGFSLFCHHPLEQVPLCSVIRFNIEYTLHVISQPVPENFCIRDLDLFSQFLFNKVLELADWDLSGNIQGSCERYHFMPRFVHRSTIDSKACHELLPMDQVLSHVLTSADPLVKLSHFNLSTEKWEEYNKSCINAIVMNPDKKPAALRVDDLQFCKDAEGLCKGKVYPYIVHHSIRPVQMSFAGDPKYQKLLRTHNKLRNLISNTPVPTRKNQDKLVKLKIELEKMRLTSSMRRDVVVEVSSKGMIKTGLKSDICQHALLLPVLVHHVRYHACLRTLDEKMGYAFKDRALFQLALTHPSYHLNFGMNPDHARNSLSNCGVKQPRYGDRKIRHLHTRKKGITQLIRVMSNLGKMEEHQSIFADDSGTLANSMGPTARRKLIGSTLDRIRHNERLEFLGDAVLELISSAHLYFMLQSKPEGCLAMYRSALVQNRHLAQLAKKLGLSDYMQYSHGPDLCVEEDLNHAMANCFEALLGAMYLESGLKSATELFTKMAFEEEDLREVWSSMPKHPLQAQMPDGDRHLIASSELLQKLQEFEQASGIEFTHIRLLARAFTHAQVGFNNLTLGSNQRMEFLGDSVLQFIVSVYLFKHFPEHHEGHLTLMTSCALPKTEPVTDDLQSTVLQSTEDDDDTMRKQTTFHVATIPAATSGVLLRSSLVNHRIQAKLARELGLDKLINFGSQPTGMKAFREKLLADTLEAFVAALYVDKGLRHVEVFCRVCLFPRLEEFIINQDWMDAKSQLQQCCLTSREQGKTPDLPQYKILQNKGPAHHKHYAVAVYYKNRRLGSGEGKSIQQAEMAAAKDALASHYFPELARQKRLLDRKHQGRRRNYWNKVPRKERENEDQEEDVEFQPQWEEMETFEVDEDNNATENWEEDENSQDRENWENEERTGCETMENWESESSDTKENWEQENSQNTRENWDQENSRDTRENWEQENSLDTRENWDQESSRDTRKNWEQENSLDTRENWDQENSRDTRENWEQENSQGTEENRDQGNSLDTGEIWEQENSRGTRENWEQENSRGTEENWEQGNSRGTEENWEQGNSRGIEENWEQGNSRDTRNNCEQEDIRDTRENWEQENSWDTRENWEPENNRDARDNWEQENSRDTRDNWEQENSRDTRENWEQDGNGEPREDCDESLGENNVSLIKENWEETKDKNSEPKKLWEVD